VELGTLLERAQVRITLLASKALIQNPLSSPVTGQPLNSSSVSSGLAKAFEPAKKKIRKLLDLLDAPDSNDLKIRRDLEGFIQPGESLLTMLQEIFFRGLAGRDLISELIGLRPAGINENWAASVCYLSSMEIVVNRKFRDMGLEGSGREGFQNRFQKIISSLSDQGIRVGKLDALLQSAFWELRHKIIHEGYCPTHEETQQIVEWVKKVLALEAVGKSALK
jgi:hypothetical protein